MDSFVKPMFKGVTAWVRIDPFRGSPMPSRHSQSAAAASVAMGIDPLDGEVVASQRTGSGHWKRGMSDVKVGVTGSGDSIIWRIAALS